MSRVLSVFTASLLLIALLFSSGALADSDRVDRGIAAYEAENYEQAFELLKPAAEEGNAEAQNYVGQMYAYGRGVEQDLEKGIRISYEAAKRGNPRAQNTIGYVYYEGIVFEKNYQKAANWYRRAAENGDRSAQRALGLHYKEGEGVDQDFAQAAQWFRRAAEQGDAHAAHELGELYRDGRGVDQDYERAVHWSRQAMRAGHSEAQSRLAWYYVAGKGVEKDLERAKELYRGLLSEGDPHAHFALGVLLQGEARENEDKTLFREAVALFREAAADGHARAMRNVAAHHVNGWGVERDYVEATAWDLLSYAHGYAESSRLIKGRLEHIYELDMKSSRSRAHELVRELDLELPGDEPFRLDG